MTSHLDFVIIGAQKGGSTSLAHVLAKHPDIWMPSREIPVFRDPVFNPETLAAFQADLDAAPPKATRGIKCPDYLARPELPARLSRIAKVPRLVVALRDPVARAISTYFWHVRWGALPVEEPNVGLTKLLDGVYTRQTPQSTDVLEWGLYGKHLQRYLQEYDRTQLHVVLSEELRENPARQHQRIYEFIGVDPDVTDTVAKTRIVNEGVYAQQRLKFLNLRNRFILEWNKDHSYSTIEPATGVVGISVSKAVAAIDRFVLSRMFGNDVPEIEPTVLERLRSYYRADTYLVGELTDIDIRKWTR